MHVEPQRSRSYVILCTRSRNHVGLAALAVTRQGQEALSAQECACAPSPPPQDCSRSTRVMVRRRREMCASRDSSK